MGGGEALRSLNERVTTAEQTAHDAVEIRDGSDASDELRELAIAETEQVRDAGASNAALLIGKLALRAHKDGDDEDSGEAARGELVKLRTGPGALKASLLVRDLFVMYERLATRRNWKWRVIAVSTTDVRGFRDVAISIGGKGTYATLSGESGVHRVQPVPETESAGRVHTSTATVRVLPAAGDHVYVKIDPSDMGDVIYRASGAGGQHVNTTESAVRVTHIPIGLIASRQDERSQYRNRDSAMDTLRQRFAEKLRQEEAQSRSAARRKQIGMSASGGERSDRIRNTIFLRIALQTIVFAV